jgi:phenylacetate-coenzyme A ligase PaaK-like adenylate-forming protein
MTELKKKLRDFIYRFRPLPDYYGQDFKKIFTFLQACRHWNRDKILEYKLKCLQKLVAHAEKNVPYYRELFIKHGIKSSDIKSFDDFAQIPVLKQDVLRDASQDLQAADFQSYEPILSRTSGTTGVTKEFYRSSYQESHRLAAMWCSLIEYGHNFRDKTVSVISPKTYDKNAPLYDNDRVINEIIINSHQIIAGKNKAILPIICNYHPHMLWFQPTLLAMLAEYSVNNSLPPLQVPLLISHAEKLYPHIYVLLRKAYEGKFIQYYGNRENTIAAWGDTSDLFHEVSDSCHLEPGTHSSVSDDQKTVPLISTSLHNYAMPLIRYDSEDLVEWHGYDKTDSKYPCFTLLGGRGKDFLLTKRGLTTQYLLPHLRKNGFDRLKQIQIEQVSLEKLVLRIVPGLEYSLESDESLLLKYAYEALPDDFKISIEYLKSIPPTKAGKYRQVISQLAIDYLNK